jgi:anti-anti-sigma regulatory factor
VGEIVEDGARRLVVDLEAVTYIDSAAIGCLMNIYRLLEDRDGALKLSGLQPRVATMVFMTGLHKIVDVHRKEAEALAAFGRPAAVQGLHASSKRAHSGAGRTLPDSRPGR